jgi:hypothetical protein
MIRECSPDLIIVCVPSVEIPKILKRLETSSVVFFIDTPVYWGDFTESQCKVLTSEQWPFLPIEQFKKILINSGQIGEVFYAENESRTFEYHGIAQLRNYFHPSKKISKITGSDLSRPGEHWHFGLVKFADNSGFLYKFSYFVKKSEIRPHQGLKVYCTEGSIISGCLNEKGNDYEIFKISKNEEDKVKHYNARVKRTDRRITNKETSFHSGTNYQELESISCDFENGKKILWENPFAGHGFNDQEIAVATLLRDAGEVALDRTKKGLYPAQRSLEDSSIVNQINTEANKA